MQVRVLVKIAGDETETTLASWREWLFDFKMFQVRSQIGNTRLEPGVDHEITAIDSTISNQHGANITFSAHTRPICGSKML